MIHPMVDQPTGTGSQDRNEVADVVRRIRLRDVVRPRVTMLTFVTLTLLGLCCLITMGLVLYKAEVFDAKLDDWIGIGALFVLIAMPYVLFAPVLVWLPRTGGESVLGLLTVVLIGGAGIAGHVDALFFSDNPLDLFVIVAMPWWQLSGIGIVTVIMGLTRLGHWVLVGRRSATPV